MFVVIDGPDGSGKSTLAKLLVEQLVKEGFPAVYTCEPTYDSSAGKKLRQLLRTGDITDAYKFADLFVEDRKEHIRDFILPSMAKGEAVICDRYKYSSLAYQQLQGVDADYIIGSNRKCLVPDYIFILMPESLDTLLERISGRGRERDVFEEREFISRTLECYRKLPEYFPGEKIIFLNAEAPTSENAGLILSKYIKPCPNTRNVRAGF